MNAERVQGYASAFFEAALERWMSTLDSVAQSLADNPHLVSRLGDTQADFAARQRLLDAVIPADADLPVRNLAYALLQSGELDLLGAISAALRERVRRAETGPLPVEVVSAVAMSDDQRTALARKLEAQYGSNLVWHYRIDPTILGGLIVRIGDKLIDGSVASKLAAMKQALGVVTEK